MFLLAIAIGFAVWLFRGTKWSRREGSDEAGPRLARAVLIKGLGVLWVVAGVLQAQPDMFTTDFYYLYPKTVMPSLLQLAAEDQPAWLMHLMHTGSHIWGTQPILFNWFVIILQAGLGIVLLAGGRRAVAWALRISIPWGLLVWIGGEGMGGIFESGGSFFIGWPGSALLYAVAAIFALLPETVWKTRFPVYLKTALGVWWLWMAWLQLKPNSDFWQASGLMAVFGNAGTVKQPALLSYGVQQLALYVADHAVLVNLILGIIMLIIGVLHFLPSWSKWFLDVTFVWILWSWWFGQDFGTLFAGLGTDLNTAPVFLVITLAAWIGRVNLDQTQRPKLGVSGRV